MPRHKRSTGRISVFKGREARLNRAIFQILGLKGPLTIYEVYKGVKALRHLKHTKYTNVNRRARALEHSAYLRKTGTAQTLAGFEASLYGLSARGYAALLFSQINLDCFIKEAEESEILQALAVFTGFAQAHPNNTYSKV